jgi:hypothetical protein
MNGQIAYQSSYLNPGWRSYMKSSDFTCPQPKNIWIFADKMMGLGDGFLQSNLNQPFYPDAPANYHHGAGSFSFADGHAELHHWSTRNGTHGLLAFPYQYGFLSPNWLAAGASDPDWIWLTNHTACRF